MEKLKSYENPRPVTVKIYASSEFKMNLPPINKLKLFNQPANGDEEQQSRTSCRTSLNKSATLSRAATSRTRMSAARIHFNNSTNSKANTVNSTDQENPDMDSNVLCWPHSEMPYNVVAATYFKRNQQIECSDKKTVNNLGNETEKPLIPNQPLNVEYNKGVVFDNTNHVSNIDYEDEDDYDDEKDYWYIKYLTFTLVFTFLGVVMISFLPEYIYNI